MEKLPKKFKKDWVKALLSGKYEQQTIGGLIFDGKYCVLAVGGDVMYGNPRKGYEVIKDQDTMSELYILNDEGVPFEVLAGVIDQWL